MKFSHRTSLGDPWVPEKRLGFLPSSPHKRCPNLHLSSEYAPALWVESWSLHPHGPSTWLGDSSEGVLAECVKGHGGFRSRFRELTCCIPDHTAHW